MTWVNELESVQNLVVSLVFFQMGTAETSQHVQTIKIWFQWWTGYPGVTPKCPDDVVLIDFQRLNEKREFYVDFKT